MKRLLLKKYSLAGKKRPKVVDLATDERAGKLVRSHVKSRMKQVEVEHVTRMIDNAGKQLDEGAYAADVTYVTNSELGFDYLRDNLAQDGGELVLQRAFNFCIIDEARTPPPLGLPCR